MDIERNFHVSRHQPYNSLAIISDESVKRPSSEFKGGSIAEEGATVKPAAPAGTTNTVTA